MTSLTLCKFHLPLQHCGMLVLSCTLFHQIYTEIENWDLNVALGWTFQYSQLMKEIKKLEFSDSRLGPA